MKKLLKRFLSLMIAFVFVIGCHCATPNNVIRVSAAYENTHTNTGNQAADIVAVAQTQIGYQEGSSNSNKYSAAFGVYNVAWCAYFISWCAKEAGISGSIINRQGIASPFSGYFNIPNTHGRSNYFPKPGDLVFYGPNSNGDHYHVGIVETVNKSTGYITTIEGNTNSNGSSEGYIVYRHTRHYQHQNICCYGIPNYSGDHKIDYSYGTNFTAYPKVTITAENIFDANHSQISSTAWIGTSDQCTIHEVYTDGCCLVSYPLDTGGTKTVHSKISLFDIHIHSYTGQRVYETDHPHVITQRCVDYASCGGYIVTGEYAQSNTCQQCWHVNWYVSAASISVKTGQSESVNISIDGIWPDTAKVFSEWDESLFNYTLSQGVLTVTGLKSGIGKIEISIYSDSAKSYIIGSKSISVTVSDSITHTPLSINSSNSATISTGGDMKYYSYTPSTSGKYVIYSTASDDTKVHLYDASLNELTNNDDGGDNRNFRLEYNLTAGTKYIFGVKYYSSSTTGTIPFVFGRVYTITYNGNGGSGAPPSQSKDYGKDITLSSTIPTRPNYTFKGWSTSSSATTATYQPGFTFSTNSNTTLYAVWELNPTNISVNSSNSAVVSTDGQMRYYTYTPTTSGKFVIYSTGSSDTKVYLYDSSLTELDSDDDGGDSTNFRLEYNLTAGTKYIFGIRYYNSSNTGTIPFTFGRVYTITYNGNGGSGAPPSQSKDYGKDITLSSTIPTRPNYTFKGWSTSSSATTATYQPSSTFSTNSNTTLYAVWQANSYTVTFKDWDGTTLKTQTVNYGGAVIAPSAPSRTGYTFAGWDTSSTADYASYQPGDSFVATSDTTLYAIWDVVFDDTEEPSEEVSSEEEPFESEPSESEPSDDIANILCGDVNGDGVVNSLDAAQTLKHDAQLIVLDVAAYVAADVNGDGIVNSLDAAMILKYDADIIDSF